MNLQVLLSQCGPFLDWARQYPLMWQRIQMVTDRIGLLSGVEGATACMELRDSFHTLFVYANEGDFSEIALAFYGYYVRYCRLLLPYLSSY